MGLSIYEEQGNSPAKVGRAVWYTHWAEGSLEVQALLDGFNLLQRGIGATLLAFGTLEAGILDLAIELYLRLRT